MTIPPLDAQELADQVLAIILADLAVNPVARALFVRDITAAEASAA